MTHCPEYETRREDVGHTLSDPVWLEHAVGCAPCGDLLRAERALAAAFSVEEARAPQPLFSSVMERVDRTPQLPRTQPAPVPTPSPLPWWVRAAAHPASAAAFLLMGLLFWQGPALRELLTTGMTWIAVQFWFPMTATLGAFFDERGPYVALGFALAFLPVLVLILYWAYRGTLALTVRLASPLPLTPR